MAIHADGAFMFPDALQDGSTYAVTVATQPIAPQQSCTVSAGGGTLSGADVEDIVVRCSDAIFTDGFDG